MARQAGYRVAGGREVTTTTSALLACCGSLRDSFSKSFGESVRENHSRPWLKVLIAGEPFCLEKAGGIRRRYRAAAGPATGPVVRQTDRGKSLQGGRISAAGERHRDRRGDHFGDDAVGDSASTTSTAQKSRDANLSEGAGLLRQSTICLLWRRGCLVIGYRVNEKRRSRTGHDQHAGVGPGEHPLGGIAGL